MGYERNLSDVTEERNTITFALVVCSAGGGFTYGGGYFSLWKPVVEARFDELVQLVVEKGDKAGPKKLTAEDRAAMRPVEATESTSLLMDFARQKNLVDNPNLGQRRRR